MPINRFLGSTMKLLLLLLLLPTIANAQFTECGEYTARGIVRGANAEVKLIVNEKTQSETVISMPKPEQIRMAGYLDKHVTIKLLLTKAFDGMTGFSEKIINTQLRIPDPIKAMDTGLELVKKMDCQKI